MSISIAAAELVDKLARKEVCLIDVRKREDYEQSPEVIEGATWRDPEKTADWAGMLPKDQEIVVYCVRGGSVSRSVADALQKSHPGVKFLEGGIVGWQDGRKRTN